jgi:hypothetical protein
MSKARDLANAGTALTTVSATELGYLDGVTSAVQTQIDAKQAVVSGVNDTEIGYLDGVTSAIQTQINGRVPATIVDAKGDIIAATAADTVSRLAVGANDTVLTADSSTGTGLKWATPAAGGITLISTTTLSGATTTLSSIPQTYNSLMVVVFGMTANSGNDDLSIRPNGVTNLVNASGTRTNVSSGSVLNGQNSDQIQLCGYSSTLRTNADNAWTVNLYNYASSTNYKPFEAFGVFVDPASNPTTINIAGGYRSNTAITSLVFAYGGTRTFAGGTVLLYGVK